MEEIEPLKDGGLEATTGIMPIQGSPFQDTGRRLTANGTFMRRASFQTMTNIGGATVVMQTHVREGGGIF